MSLLGTFRLFPYGSWRALSALSLFWPVDRTEGPRGLSVLSEARVVICVVIMAACVVWKVLRGLLSEAIVYSLIAPSNTLVEGLLAVVNPPSPTLISGSSTLSDPIYIWCSSDDYDINY